MTRSLFRKLRALLRSKEDGFIASGLYALGEIALNYKLQDLIAFQTHGALWELLNFSEKFVSHESEKLRNQVLQAYKKLDDEKIEARILQIYEKCQSPETRSSIEKYATKKAS